jgi:hypothetical protein
MRNTSTQFGTKRIVKAATVTAGLLVAHTTFAATMEEQFHKMWDKSVTGTGGRFKPKVGCISLATSALGAVRYIPFSNSTAAICGVPTFNSEGGIAGEQNCGGPFVVLPR